MALAQPILPFLRPLGPPRPCTLRHLFRFSTASRFRVEATSSPSSSAASLSCSSNSASKFPIKAQILPNATRSAELATAEAATDVDNATASASTPPPAPAALPRLKYHVARTPSNQLPVYQDSKRGGNLHQTLIRKITGDARVLSDDIRQHLGLRDKDVVVNPVTGHVVVKVGLDSLFK
ncbi:hypothetical protein AOQ84DRAFT_228547 [Glonium stellatum]|uniref:Large ribosomal subunit protein mL49 n=1 Tax=Glonium stellatum TaxID=574774 RepID=A0A8E2JWP0_9PEZI|nr:hypothetical protein AOQ84DRAFT_228547 [Glonium stellatum]